MKRSRLTNEQKRIMELEDALMNVLEVQITPSTPHHDEWEAAVEHGRRILRNRVIKGWRKTPPLEGYELEEQYRIGMELDYVGRED